MEIIIKLNTVKLLMVKLTLVDVGKETVQV